MSLKRRLKKMIKRNNKNQVIAGVHQPKKEFRIYDEIVYIHLIRFC
jgi:hypothetical protein